MSRIFDKKSLQTRCYSFLLLSSLLFGCLDSGGGKDSRNDCSVADHCDGQNIRLRQVETYFFEQETDTVTSFVDIAEFDYNSQNQWIGGITRRVAEADFDYIIEYFPDGKMSRSTKTYIDDLGNEAVVTLDYFYAGAFLDRSQSSTVIRDSDDVLIKTIAEIFDYSFSGGQLDEILFDVSDSALGNSDFRYDFTYSGGRIASILITQQSNGRPDYTFREYSYDSTGKIDESITYRQNSSNVQVEQERSSYEYFQDGVIKRKISIINSTPSQKIETHYIWEAGLCTTNQTFGDRLFPTPEVINFPCL